MGRTLADIRESLPADRYERIARERDAMLEAMDGLRALRESLGLSQAEVAERLETSQPAVSKLENQGDMSFSSLRRYVEALGGTVELVVTLPGHGAVRLDEPDDLADTQLPDTE